MSCSALIFECLLEATKRIFVETCRNEEALEMVVDVIESYFYLLDPTQKVKENRSLF